MRTCSKCKTEKPVSHFWKQRGPYYDCWCKPCRNTYAKQRRALNPRPSSALPRPLGDNPFASMQPQVLAYIAGIVDGEGCICTLSPNFLPRVVVTNIHRPVMEWIGERIGRRPRAILRRIGDSRRQAYHLAVSGTRAYHLLTSIRPYLIIKADQADVAIGLGATHSAPLVHGKIDVSVMQERLRLHLLLRELKRIEYPVDA